MAIREGRWDCTSCGSEGFTPAQMSCPSCGAPRADDVKFYLPDDARVVTDAAALARAKAGADWYCSYCGAGSPAAAIGCTTCGASKEDSKHHAVTDHLDQPAAPPAAATTQTSGGATAVKLGAGGMAAALGCATLCCLFMILAVVGGTKDVAAEVTGFSWERSITVQEHKPVTEGGWTTPAGAKVLGQEQKVHHEEDVFSHYEQRTRKQQVQVGSKTVVVGQRDLGNGYFEDITNEEPVYETRDEEYQEKVMKKKPVYQTWYRYQVMKWVDVDTRTARGEDQQPTWPEVTLKEKQREGPRKETYAVKLRDPTANKTYACALPEAQWKAYSAGQKVNAKIQGDEVKSVGPLQVEVEARSGRALR